ncbi:TraM recognition site of TraD and TraG [Desulfonatronum thiosulfatophilum]|uniref:TraM recognition site of TraD and TraG n=1 Tax=Desulfonatronum thiosulfatophilum TaxID=617002 RepID=A0A1G6EWD7_9BACT|nr:TraM recognition domain-containing protein [Desulfonatronum thiosulfatophilum]SDB61774.1 TraM recognition site of TraD and TraG [Desulfonatronum thiosulfatophilum]
MGRKNVQELVATAAKAEAWRLTKHESYSDDDRLPHDLRDKNGFGIGYGDGLSEAGRNPWGDVTLGSVPVGGFFITSVLCFLTVFAPAYAFFLTNLLNLHDASYIGSVALLIVFSVVSAYYTVMMWITVLSVFIAFITLMFMITTGDNLLFIVVASGVISGALPYINQAMFNTRRSGRPLQLGSFAQAPKWGQEARRKQNQEAIRNRHSPFMELGVAMGVLRSERGDRLAPDAGLPMGLDMEDMKDHVFIFGQDGTGKTSGIFYPMIQKIVGSVDNTGIFVVDGSGKLAKGINIEGYTLISPESNIKIALMEGLLPEDVVEAFVSTISDKKKEKSTIFQDAEMLLLQAGILLHAASNYDREMCTWNISNLYKMINSKNYRLEVARILAHQKNILSERDDNLKFRIDVRSKWRQIDDAAKHFLHLFDKLGDHSLMRIVGMLNSWINMLLKDDDLQKWCHNDTGFDITTVFRGGRVGLHLPSYRYGKASTAITALMKLRLYRYASHRGEEWYKQEGQTPVAFFLDDAQNILTRSDMQMASFARMLGIIFVVSVQTYEQLSIKFGKGDADAFIGQFKSLISFKSSSQTYRYLQNRFGSMLSLRNLHGKVVPMDANIECRNLLNCHHFDENNSNRQNDDSNTEIAEHEVSMKPSKKKIPSNKDTMNMHRNDVVSSPIIAMHELNDILCEPFAAVAMFNRASVPRRDFMKVVPVLKA